jgi:hypothetical protein
VSRPYLYLHVYVDVPRERIEIEGDRDALVTLKSAINDALGRLGRGWTDVSDRGGVDRTVFVTRIGP